MTGQFTIARSIPLRAFHADLRECTLLKITPKIRFLNNAYYKFWHSALGTKTKRTPFFDFSVNFKY